jgi:hypothetical protein
MVKQLLVMVAAVAVVAASIYYRREQARNATDDTDPLRYERMSWVGISVDYRKEPLVAWEIISGPKQLELTGAGSTCSSAIGSMRRSRPTLGKRSITARRRRRTSRRREAVTRRRCRCSKSGMVEDEWGNCKRAGAG